MADSLTGWFIGRFTNRRSADSQQPADCIYLFIVYLSKLSLAVTVAVLYAWWTVRWTGDERELSLRDVSCHSEICLEVLGKTTRVFTVDQKHSE